MEQKKLWESKTIWVNLVTMGAMVINQMLTITAADGTSVPFIDLSPAIQTGLLALINFILRIVTKKEIVW